MSAAIVGAAVIGLLLLTLVWAVFSKVDRSRRGYSDYSGSGSWFFFDTGCSHDHGDYSDSGGD